MLTTILAVWFGGSTLFCLALLAAAARPHAKPRFEIRVPQDREAARFAVESYCEGEECVGSHATAVF